MTRPVAEDWPVSVDTTRDERGALWVTMTFIHPDGTRAAYGYSREGTVFLIEALTTALRILETESGN